MTNTTKDALDNIDLTEGLSLIDFFNGSPEVRTDTIPAMLAAAREEGALTVYIASKTKHAPVWRDMRAKGLSINSTWIDEAGQGETADFADLWRRCVAEATAATALIAYREPGEILKGAWVEIGAALAAGRTVYLVGDFAEFSICHHPQVILWSGTVEQAAREEGALAMREAAARLMDADAEDMRAEGDATYWMAEDDAKRIRALDPKEVVK